MSNGGPETLRDWIDYLHTAAQVPEGHPDYAEAREAVAQAIRKIHALNVGAQMRDVNADQPTPAQAALGGLLHGASLGTGEVVSGLGSAISGEGFAPGAQRYRESLGELQAAHPNIAAGTELLGSIGLPGAAIGQAGTKGIQAGVPLVLGEVAKRVGQGAIAGAVPGAIAGFSAGGADPGDLPARLSGAARGGAYGAAVGGAGAGLAIPFARRHAEHAAELGARGARRRTVSIREELAKLRLAREQQAGSPAARAESELQPRPTPEALSADAEQAFRDFEAGRISGDDLRVALDVAAGRDVPAAGARAGPITTRLRARRAPKAAAPAAPTPAPSDVTITGNVISGTPLPGIVTAAPAPARPGIGEPAIPGKPELGTVVKAGKYQRAAPSTRVASSAASLNLRAKGPAAIADFLQEQLDLAQQMGLPAGPQGLQRVIGRLGLTPQEVSAVQRELATRARKKGAA